MSASGLTNSGCVGGLAYLHEENVRIQALIDEEFGKIDPEDWE
jgi:hypothetical protein